MHAAAESSPEGVASSNLDARLRAGLATTRLPGWWLFGAIAFTLAAFLAAIAFGPAHIPIGRVVAELADRLPFVHIDSGLSPLRATIVTEYRLPRALLALIVGAVLATSVARIKARSATRSRIRIYSAWHRAPASVRRSR